MDTSTMTERSEQPMVDPLYEREDDAVPGPFYVMKDQCIICDFPPELAPRCIRMKNAQCNADKYCHVYKQPETLKELDSVFEAMAGSCVQAIRYCGTDPRVLSRLTALGMSDLCDATEQARQNKRMESNG